MKLAIVGGRDYKDFDTLKKTIYRYFFGKEENNKDLFLFDTIVSGAASGVDSLSARFAIENGINLVEFPADWEKWGKAAGPIRNEKIIEVSDVVLAIWDGKSPGTRSSIDIARKLKKTTVIYYY